MEEKLRAISLAALFCAGICLLALWLFPAADARAAAGSFCAEVKIEIRQELTLERQAFDAHMRINNGLSHVSLENVRVDVLFADENGNPVAATSDPFDTSALFFIRLDSMERIGGVDGSGMVAPSTSADIHWLIIPAPGAAGGLESGTLYYVGARLAYTMGGEAFETDVSPDYIYVKPMPELALDYFLPSEVYGDDPFTAAIEPEIPFSLGVRVKNNGFGVARDLKIESAQPQIVENENGLLIGFVIQGSQVNGKPAEETLLADFGDIDPGASGTARWIMTCSLSGRFVDFDAAFSHADELGGEVTSLLGAVETHFLEREVLVDLPGRDRIPDFLARDGDLYHVYESDSVDNAVTDQSGGAVLAHLDQAGTETRCRLTVPVTAGFLLVKLPDPLDGRRVLKEVVRADGKRIKPENAWLSQVRNQSDGWDYFFSLFDTGGGDYTVVFASPASVPQPPVLQFIPDRSRAEGEQISFIVEASDPNGTTPTLSAAPLPVGAVFADLGDGTALFDWTPSFGQAGVYPITFTASDGVLEASRQAVITIYAGDDSDGDGMPDAWEMAHFGTLDRDGSGDFDGDGIADLEEYLGGTDPSREDFVPGPPVVLSPAPGMHVASTTPEFRIQNPLDPDGDPVVCQIEVYADAGMTLPLVQDLEVDAAAAETLWTVPIPLEDNARCFWRARATDGAGCSPWIYGSFFVNTANDPPGPFAISSPADGSQVPGPPPLEVTDAADPDGDALSYGFTIYADSAMETVVASSPALPAGGAGTTAWQAPDSLENTTYYWRAFTEDPDGARRETSLASFAIDPANGAPAAPAIASPPDGGEVAALSTGLVVTNATDPEGDPLGYRFELDERPTFDGSGKLASPTVEPGAGTTAWPAAGLRENSWYSWRVRATDGAAHSPWTAALFFVSTVNDAPPAPRAKNPGRHAWSTTRTPALEVLEAADPDGDGVLYRFRVFTDAELTALVAEGESAAPAWQAQQGLANNRWYYWTAQVVDEHGLAGPWMAAIPVFVRETGPPPEVAVRVGTDQGRSLSDIRVYAFTAGGSYTGLSARTDETGTAVFQTDQFAAGEYRFRADYLGRQFWSEIHPIPTPAEVAVVIPEETATLQVRFADGPAAGVKVYLFAEAGSYLGVSGTTDAAGEVSFDIPEGYDFKFRADILGSQYWSDPVSATAGGENAFALEAGGGLLTVAVAQDAQTPMAGIKVYLFTPAGSYLGLTRTTDSAGAVSFAVPAGAYQVRADYLGYHFWSGEALVGQDTPLDLFIPHQDVAVTVEGAFGQSNQPLAGVKVYLFTPAGSYQGVNHTTDAAGRALFRLPQTAYKVRADYLSGQYWSGEFTAEDTAVRVSMADAAVTVTGNGDPLAAVNVYCFMAGAYLGLNQTTGADGGTVFRLPAGRYQFRADYQGSQFWSPEADLWADQSNPVEVSTGGGRFTLTVAKGAEAPLEGVSCYVFSQGGSYLGMNQVTSSDGRVSFGLADGAYKIRVDCLGYQFWTPAYEIPATLEDTFQIPHRSTAVTVQGECQGAYPLAGIPVYLFLPSGAYLGLSRTTDAEGRVCFDLPDAAYQVRADYLGAQFWSPVFQHQDAAVPVPEGEARVQVLGGGQPLAGVPVYLFTADGAYLGRHQPTDSQGEAVFRVPSGAYRFRADYQGSQYWAEAAVQAGIDNPVPLDTGGGAFLLTVDTGQGPLAGAKAYVFSEAGAYLGMSGATDAAGQVGFALADGAYQFRVDHLGYRFWTDPYVVDGDMSAVFSILHRTLTATVQGRYLAPEPLADVKVYLFSAAGAYLGQNRLTDASGQAAFFLPDAAYKIRADHLGQQFWSEPFTGTDPFVEIPRGEALIHATAGGSGLAGAKVYVFTLAGSYLGLNAVTDAAGRAAFILPAGNYQFRVDAGGAQYWSAETEISAGQGIPVEVEAAP